MTIDQPSVAQPAWQDELPSEELRAFYEKLPREITRCCEDARQDMRKAHAVWRDAYTRALVAVHNALVAQQDGFDFKAWCTAAGINYRTAHSTVSRALAAERKPAEAAEAAEQADDMQMHIARSVNDREGVARVALTQPPEPLSRASASDQYRDRSIIKLTFNFPRDEHDRVMSGLRRVMESQGLERREEALLHIFEVYEGRAPLGTEATSVQALSLHEEVTA